MMISNQPDFQWPVGLRRTRPRERLLSVLAAAETPLTVHQIQAAVDADGEPSVWLSTLYRALESFEGTDTVVRTPMPDGSLAVYELNRYGHRHYAFCVGCSRMVAVEHCPVDPAADCLADPGFRITGHKLEVFGYCSDCQKKNDGPR